MPRRKSWHKKKTFSSRGRKIFDVGVNLQKNAWLVLLPAILICSYLAAKVAALFVAGYFPDDVMIPVQGATMSPAQASGIKKSDLTAILKRNFFDPEESNFDGKVSVDTSVTEPEVEPDEDVDLSQMKAVKSSLKVELLGTASYGNGEDDRSTAVIKGDKETGVFWISKEPSFSSGVKLVRILDKRIEFVNNKRLEYIEISSAGKGPTEVTASKDIASKMTRKVDSSAPAEIKLTDGKFQIPRSELNKALTDVNRLFNEIRITPYFQEGQAVGLRVLDVSKNSLFEKLGIKKGDILKNINGKTLDVNSAMQLFQELKDEANFDLDLERDGTTKSQSYEVI